MVITSGVFPAYKKGDLIRPDRGILAPLSCPIPDLANRLVAATVRADAQYPMIERSIEVRSEVERSEGFRIVTRGKADDQALG